MVRLGSASVRLLLHESCELLMRDRHDMLAPWIGTPLDIGGSLPEPGDSFLLQAGVAGLNGSAHLDLLVSAA